MTVVHIGLIFLATVEAADKVAFYLLTDFERVECRWILQAARYIDAVRLLCLACCVSYIVHTISYIRLFMSV